MIDTVSQTTILDKVDIAKRRTYTDPELGICIYLDDSSSMGDEGEDEGSQDGQLQQKLLETDYDETSKKSSDKPENTKKPKRLYSDKIVTRKPRSITTTRLPRRVVDRIDGTIYRFKGLFVVAQGKNIRCMEHKLVLRQCPHCSTKRK